MPASTRGQHRRDASKVPQRQRPTARPPPNELQDMIIANSLLDEYGSFHPMRRENIIQRRNLMLANSDMHARCVAFMWRQESLTFSSFPELKKYVNRVRIAMRALPRGQRSRSQGLCLPLVSACQSQILTYASVYW